MGNLCSSNPKGNTADVPIQTIAREKRVSTYLNPTHIK